MRNEVQWEKPIFIVGHARSGTTHLTRTLNRHPEIALTREANLAYYFKVMFELGNLPVMKPATIGNIELQGMVLEVYQPTLRPVLLEGSRAIWMEFHRRAFEDRSFSRWGDMFHWVDAIPDLIQVFPDAQFVHLVRDGRDSTMSMLRYYERARNKKPYLETRTFEQHCHSWVYNVTRTNETLDGHRNALSIHYEDLVRQPVETIRQITGFLDLPAPDEFLVKVRAGDAEFFSKHATSPGPEQSIGRWKTEMTDDQKALAQEIMGEALVQSGYGPGSTE